MTQEEKQLSFIDISGRLHYGVIVNYKENEYDHRKWKITNLHILSYSKSGTLIDTDYDGWISYEEHKGCGMSTGSRPFRFGEVLPYLRPMSSMTEKECEEFRWLNDQCDAMPTFKYIPVENYRIYDWLNRHHFDYRGMIEKGLAIEVTEEDNYLLSSLDTLEVKDVDLEKEIKDYIHALPHAKTGVPNGWRLSWHEDKVIEIARHFYELGIKSKGE